MSRLAWFWVILVLAAAAAVVLTVNLVPQQDVCAVVKVHRHHVTCVLKTLE